MVDEVYASCEWVDGYGAHAKRVTEEFGAAELTAATAIVASRPDIRRWQIDRVSGPGSAVQIGVMRDGDTGPVYNVVLPASVRSNATTLLVWIEGQVDNEYLAKYDLYEEERRIMSEQLKLDARRDRVRQSRG